MNDVRVGFVGVDQYLDLPRERDTWLLKPLLPISGACLLYGAPKTGKSYLAIQLGLALSGQAPDWLGFPVVHKGKVLYLQLDTPRTVWALRFEDMIKKGGLKYDTNTLLLADRECIEYYPFDIIQPKHMQYLFALVRKHDPTAVIIDTLRESHSGDSDSDTSMRNVISNLVGAVHPAALIVVSHSRKTIADQDKDIMDDHRGSSFVPGRMDAILRLTKTRLYYAGRSIEAGDIKLERLDNGLWAPAVDGTGPAIIKVMADNSLTTMRAKARVLGTLIAKSEEASMSILRRHTSALETAHKTA